MIKILFVLILTLISACSSRKEVQLNRNRLDSVSLSLSRENAFDRLAEAMRKSQRRASVTEIEFYRSDSTIFDVSIDNAAVDLARIRGQPIKSIRQTTVEELEENKGKESESSTNKEAREKAVVRKETKSEQKRTETKGVSLKGYIYTALFAIAMYLFHRPVSSLTKRLLKRKRKIP
ncbi:hypothetical protein HMPREF1990_00434 [Porphyromonas gingivalis W4087]|uniref:hypothetical protein n=1 Tax=Porphyromonas gingivalis TaxID=837 RepID=UPI0003AD52B0|nr:hypothetical protein [Porphyromonas gingivalis]ERJ90812.1 hypothetical protein HMPREF1990_00434 [Porphyromonas gingivalis W4087]PDP62324.1 hypothetical protein CLI83_06240 [Porphyromonas gingivalis]PDP75552.1 hypothetical protein CLI79_03515 [Porphyromonas gingivalis]